MDSRLSFVTLVVRNITDSRRFYVDGLGWQPELAAPEVLMFRVAERVVLSLWDFDAATAELGTAPSMGGVPPVTLAHNLRTKEGVDRVLESARTLGAQVWEAQERDWGGYSGYFADPDGYRWEICVNSGEIGQSVLPGAGEPD